MRALFGQTRRGWGLGDVVIGLLAGFALSGLLGSLGFALSGGNESALGVSAMSAIGLWMGMVGAAVIASRLKGAGTLAQDFGFAWKRSDLPIGVVVGVVSQVAALPLVAIVLSPLIGRPEVSGPAKELLGRARGPGQALMVLFIVVGAPVVEELFYRGLMLRSLQKRLGVVLAVGASGVLFALSHQSELSLQGLILIWVSLGTFGAILATLAVRTGRLGAPIAAHATFNAFTVLYVLLG